MPRTKPPAIDWEAIERDYRAGIVSIREIARVHKISEASIRGKADRAVPRWERNLSGRVREAVREKIVREDARSDPAHPLSDGQIVEQASAVGLGIVRRSRTSVSAAHEATIELLRRVRQAIDEQEELRLAAEEETSPVESDTEESARARRERLSRRAKLLQAVGLGAHIASIQSIAATLKSIVPLERLVYGIDEKAPPDSDDALGQLHKELSGNAFRPDESNPSPAP